VLQLSVVDTAQFINLLRPGHPPSEPRKILRVKRPLKKKLGSSLESCACDRLPVASFSSNLRILALETELRWVEGEVGAEIGTG
jgi:hypothetical protein